MQNASYAIRYSDLMANNEDWAVNISCMALFVIEHENETMVHVFVRY